MVGPVNRGIIAPSLGEAGAASPIEKGMQHKSVPSGKARLGSTAMRTMLDWDSNVNPGIELLFRVTAPYEAVLPDKLFANCYGRF